MKKRRADERLFEELNLESLSLARALIMEGRAFAGERKLKSPGELVPEKETMRVRGALDPYVSRGAHKLKKALEVFALDVRGATCVDVGASTGGFTDVLLRAGAKHVYAVDVGYNLLDYRLRADARVTVMERVNARFLRPEDFPQRPSFGGYGRVLHLPGGGSARGAFRARWAEPALCGARQAAVRGPARGRGGEGRGARRGCAPARAGGDHRLRAYAGLEMRGAGFFPIRGPEGNIEFLLYIVPADAEAEALHEYAISDTIRRAYDKFIKKSE